MEEVLAPSDGVCQSLGTARKHDGSKGEHYGSQGLVRMEQERRDLYGW